MKDENQGTGSFSDNKFCPLSAVNCTTVGVAWAALRSAKSSSQAAAASYGHGSN